MVFAAVISPRRILRYVGLEVRRLLLEFLTSKFVPIKGDVRELLEMRKIAKAVTVHSRETVTATLTAAATATTTITIAATTKTVTATITAGAGWLCGRI